MPDIFLHIPKTGGGSALSALKWVYSPGSVYQLPDKDPMLHAWKATDTLERVPPHGLLTGHIPYGAHRHLTGRCRYFTILRHPVERVVSHYFYHQAQRPESRLALLSLPEFLESEHTIAESNRQVRYLAATDPEADPKAALITAKNRLVNDFTAFGLTHRFDESLLIFRRKFDWNRLPFYVFRNVNSKRLSIDQLPDDAIQAVREKNRLDLNLYRFAQERFAATRRAMPSEFEQELSRFRRWNQISQSVTPLFLWLYRKGHYHLFT